MDRITIIKKIKEKGIFKLFYDKFIEITYEKQNLIMLERELKPLPLRKASGKFKGHMKLYQKEVSFNKFKRYFEEDLVDIEYLFSLGLYCAVMEKAGNVVAYMWYADSDYYEREINFLFSLKKNQIYQFAGIIHPDFRRTSISYDVLKYSWDYFIEKGYTSVFCNVEEKNKSSLRLHKKLNFSEMGEVIIYTRLLNHKKSVLKAYSVSKLNNDR